MTRRRIAIVLGTVLMIAAGVVAGLLVGRSAASSDVERDERATERASEQEDRLRDRRDVLDARVDALEPQLEPLGKVTTTPPLLGTATGTTEVELGATFSVDGGDYRVRGLEVVDSFRSIDPRRPARTRAGFRWALVEVDYTNRTREEQSPACGTLQTVRLVLVDGTTVDEYRQEPPVRAGTYGTCGEYVMPRRTVRWFAPVLVPAGARIAGVHVADVYARTSDSPYNVVAGTAAWMPFDDPLEVGEVGDGPIGEAWVEGTAA